MIELLRYHRVKSQGLVSATINDQGMVCVAFKRFDVENGKEIEPETCLLTFPELETRFAELIDELEVVKELLALKKD